MHSDAIRRVEGVKDGKQYTIPVESALEAVRNGENPELTTRQKHTRECFVVLEEGSDAKRLKKKLRICQTISQNTIPQCILSAKRN